MNLDIPNLDGKIDAESVENWVQQLESYYTVNQLSEVEKITIASLNMSTLRTLLVGESIDKDGKRRRPHQHMGKICRICPKGVLSTQLPLKSVQ